MHSDKTDLLVFWNKHLLCKRNNWQGAKALPRRDVDLFLCPRDGDVRFRVAQFRHGECGWCRHDGCGQKMFWRCLRQKRKLRWAQMSIPQRPTPHRKGSWLGRMVLLQTNPGMGADHGWNGLEEERKTQHLAKALINRQKTRIKQRAPCVRVWKR